MSILALFIVYMILSFQAVFVRRPRPNIKKTVLLQGTPIFIFAGHDGHPDVPFFKSSSLFEKHARRG
ncbi:MAG: hypothetical protein IJ657_08265 [Acidaminococcaceae bacterium]|nr:hypothetical protein [Acidaminococcaceae bacterium]